MPQQRIQRSRPLRRQRRSQFIDLCSRRRTTAPHGGFGGEEAGVVGDQCSVVNKSIVDSNWV